MPADRDSLPRQNDAAEIRRLRSRLEALKQESDRRIAAKDRVIVDQEKVIIRLERELEASARAL